jgi:hypothetical protein
LCAPGDEVCCFLQCCLASLPSTMKGWSVYMRELKCCRGRAPCRYIWSKPYS